MNQEQIILNYLRDLGEWKREYEIRCMNTPYGWIGARGDRTVREMMKRGLLDKSKDGKYRIVKYPKPLPILQGIELLR